MLSIDITDKQIKLVRGNLMGSKVRIMETAVRDLPREAVTNGYIIDTPAVADAIIDIISECGIVEKETIVSINSSLILYKEVMLPKIRNLRNTIAIEAMLLNAMGITSEYNISYSIVGEVKGEKDEEGHKQPDMLKFMATACPQRMVDGYKLLFTHVGLTLKQINISNSCISRLIRNTPQLFLEMPLLLVQVENDTLSLNLYENNQVSMTRFIIVDSAEYSNAPDYINRAIYDNIYRMMQFIGGQKNHAPIKNIMCYGEIKDFDELKTELNPYGIPVSMLEMPQNIFTFCEFDFEQLANAIGALFKVHRVFDHVNLLDTAAVREKERGNKYFLTLGMTALIAGAAVFMATYGLYMYNNSLNAKIDAIQNEMSENQYEQRNVELSNKLGILSNLQTFYESARSAKVLFDYQPKAYTGVVDKLESVMFTGMSIDGMVSVNNYSVSASFTASDSSQPSDYVMALLAQGYFKNISYSGFTGSDNEFGRQTYSFSLTMEISGGNGIETSD